MVFLAAHELAEGCGVMLDGRQHDVGGPQLQGWAPTPNYIGQHLAQYTTS